MGSDIYSLVHWSYIFLGIIFFYIDSFISCYMLAETLKNSSIQFSVFSSKDLWATELSAQF